MRIGELLSLTLGDIDFEYNAKISNALCDNLFETAAEQVAVFFWLYKELLKNLPKGKKNMI